MTRNVAASVHQRLLNHAREQGRRFNDILQRYALERSVSAGARLIRRVQADDKPSPVRQQSRRSVPW